MIGIDSTGPCRPPERQHRHQHRHRHRATTAVTMAAVASAWLLLAGCGGSDPAADESPRPRESGTMSSSASAPPTRPPEPTPEVTVTSPDDAAVPPVGTPLPPSPPGTAPEAPPAVLTQADDGRTFSLSPGAEVRWQLDGAWSWQEPVVEGSAVTLTPVNYFDDPGFVEWLVGAAAAGTSTVSATGDPGCGDSTQCPPVTVRIVFVVR